MKKSYWIGQSQTVHSLQLLFKTSQELRWSDSRN